MTKRKYRKVSLHQKAMSLMKLSWLEKGKYLVSDPA